ncbi:MULTISPECIES: LytR/AlgR family response regulator transcription factor [Ferruginibacter]|jgi:two-component system, LytTR family, response regulator|uniref:LytR/AlgR family response regulator transcription factor n=1 Tax=Ferruginibacter sp. SUN106 TaxID=2978348 RepID=UPI003D3651EF
MLKALLIDDEERATDSLRLMIEKAVPEIMQVKVCNDSRKAAEIIHEFQPGLVFLDIQMPHLNGFQMLEKMPNKNFKLIFTTAYNEYAIQAIRFSAFDYLLKPIDVEELQLSVQRFLQTTQDYKEQYDLLKNIMHNIQSPSSDEFRLALPTKEGVHYLQPADIIRCEAVGNYTKFFTEGGKSYLISKTLGEYDALLTPQHFIRTHKSHLVNKKFISFIDHDGFAVLKDKTKVEVSRRRKEEVMEALK